MIGRIFLTKDERKNHEADTQRLQDPNRNLRCGSQQISRDSTDRDKSTTPPQQQHNTIHSTPHTGTHTTRSAQNAQRTNAPHTHTTRDCDYSTFFFHASSVKILVLAIGPALSKGRPSGSASLAPCFFVPSSLFHQKQGCNTSPHHRIRMLLMMHLETRLVIAPLSDGGRNGDEASGSHGRLRAARTNLRPYFCGRNLETSRNGREERRPEVFSLCHFGHKQQIDSKQQRDVKRRRRFPQKIACPLAGLFRCRVTRPHSRRAASVPAVGLEFLMHVPPRPLRQTLAKVFGFVCSSHLACHQTRFAARQRVLWSVPSGSGGEWPQQGNNHPRPNITMADLLVPSVGKKPKNSRPNTASSSGSRSRSASLDSCEEKHNSKLGRNLHVHSFLRRLFWLPQRNKRRAYIALLGIIFSLAFDH